MLMFMGLIISLVFVIMGVPMLVLVDMFLGAVRVLVLMFVSMFVLVNMHV